MVKEHDILINLEQIHDFAYTDVMKTREGEPFTMRVDNRDGMILFTQLNGRVTDEIHMHVSSFAAVIKALGVDDVVEGNFTLEYTGEAYNAKKAGK